MFKDLQKQFWESKKREKRRQPDNPVVKAFAAPKIDFIRKNIEIKENTTLLDVGCGNGFFTWHLAKICDVTGLDFSQKMLEINPHKKLTLGDAENLPFPDNKFDIAFCSNLLHHLGNPEKVIKEMKRVSKKFIIISEPNRNNPLMFMFGLIKKEERNSLKFTAGYLNKICRKNNLNPVKILISGFVYPNKTPQFLLPIVSKLNFNNPFGSYVTGIYIKNPKSQAPNNKQIPMTQIQNPKQYNLKE